MAEQFRGIQAMKGRLLSLLLVVSIVLGAAPTGSAAADPFKDQLSHNEMFRALEKAIKKNDPDVLDRLGASPDALKLLRAYDVQSLSEVLDAVFANLNLSNVGGNANGNNSAGAAASSDADAPANYQGFSVEIKGVDNAPSGVDGSWEACRGGGLRFVESQGVSVGTDGERHFTPGNATVSELTLEGPMTDVRQPLKAFVRAKDVGTPPLNVTLSFNGSFQTNDNSKRISFGAFAAHWYRDEVLFATINATAFQMIVYNIERTDANGKACADPPRLLLVGPSSDLLPRMPVMIGGTGFDVGAIPYFGTTPSISLFHWSVQNIPLIGSLAVGVTIVPPAAPHGPGDVKVEYLGQMSDPFPFTVDGDTGNGTGNGTANNTSKRLHFSTQLSLTFRAVDPKAAPEGKSQISISFDCQMDWHNSTMPGPKQDVVSGTEYSSRRGNFVTRVDMDVKQPDLLAWIFDRASKAGPGNATVSASSQDDNETRTWGFTDCFPTEFDPGDYDTASTTKVETIEVRVGHVEMA